MVRVNSSYGKLAKSYLFVEIGRRVAVYQEQHPEADIIKLGIGDVTRPLSPSVVEAFHRGVDEQASAETFRGYGPEQGYEFLRTRIAEVDFRSRGCPIDADEIFVSDGAKCDTGNFQELFAVDSVIAVPDPVYPVYVDSNVMAGRTGALRDGRYEGLVYLEGTRENGFVPPPPTDAVDLIYLCFPNNPTGVCASKEQLTEWVEYAREHGALILFDAAYEAFIRDDSPHSIYEIPGAAEVAVEFRSLSKTAGFTGTRLAYTIVPKAIEIGDAAGTRHKLWEMWNRRQSTKFNGVSFPVQRAAEAVFSHKGQAEVRTQSDYYLENARMIRAAMESLGYECTGGKNSPYVWIASRGSSWELFDTFLTETGVVITPGAGFGTKGEGFVRISGFNDREKVEEAIERIKAKLPPTAEAR
ncbi:MAG: LL-diaminopimelate aminotransferase [Spirochaetales bacterium]